MSAAAHAHGSVEETLRSVVEPLAALERGAGSEGERRAAELLAGMLERAGARDVRVEDATFRGENFARVLLPLGLIGFLGNRLVVRGRRLRGALLASVAAALTIDDAENGRRPWRRLVARERATQNVVAVTGDPGSDRTLVVLAHHDAAPTGVLFDQTLQRSLAKRFPDYLAARDEALPIWYPVLAGPVVTLAAALTGSRRLARLGGMFSAVALAFGFDVARHRVVPGANDNLTACAVLVALAERLGELTGLRVVLVSCGAEEVLQGGIYGFTEQHLKPLDRGRTWVVNLDTVGSPELILVEGEGPFFVHRYCDPSFRDLVAAAAERATGEPLRRGPVARASTDSIVPSRAGYPSALLCSWEPDTKLMTNYHLMTDTPDGLHYETVGRAVDVVEAVARKLASGGGGDG